MTITITTSSTPTFSSALAVPARSEKTHEFQSVGIMQQLLENSEYLRNRVPGAATSLFIWLPIQQHSSAAVDWTTTCADYPYLLAGAGSMASGDSVRCYWHLQPLLPSSGKLVSHGAFLKGASGHSYPIQYPPVLTTLQLNPGTFPQTLVTDWATTDDGTGASYESVHLLSHTITTPIPIVPGYDIWMALRNERGTNSEINLTVLAAYIEVAPL